MNTHRKKATSISGLMLDQAQFKWPHNPNENQYPFSLPLIRNLKEIKFPTPVTFFVGENGSGKSTIFEE